MSSPYGLVKHYNIKAHDTIQKSRQKAHQSIPMPILSHPSLYTILKVNSICGVAALVSYLVIEFIYLFNKPET